MHPVLRTWLARLSEAILTTAPKPMLPIAEGAEPLHARTIRDRETFTAPVAAAAAAAVATFTVISEDVVVNALGIVFHQSFKLLVEECDPVGPVGSRIIVDGAEAVCDLISDAFAVRS